jgi:hypothetical protein
VQGASSAQTLLERLHDVRRTGHGRWLARCPAHKDRRSSLSVRELDDGRVLIHCFVACSAKAVLGAVALISRRFFLFARCETRRRPCAR